MSINIDDGILSSAIGDIPPILKPVNSLHSSAFAFVIGKFIKSDIFFIEAYLSPETRQRWNFFSESLNKRLFTIEPTSVLSDWDASSAVLAVSSSSINFILLSNFFRNDSTFLTVFFSRRLLIDYY